MIIVDFLRQGFANLYFVAQKKLRISKLSHKKAALYAKIDDRYQLIGKEVYRNRGRVDQHNDRFDILGREIAELEDSILGLEQEIVSARKQGLAERFVRKELSYAQPGEDTKKCYKCASILPDSALYCAHCGFRQEIATRQLEGETIESPSADQVQETEIEQIN